MQQRGILSRGCWTSHRHEAELLGRVGCDTDADWRRRCTFPSVWSEVLRRLRRRNRANSAKSMQPRRIRDKIPESIKGRNRTLGVSDDLDDLIAADTHWPSAIQRGNCPLMSLLVSSICPVKMSCSLTGLTGHPTWQFGSLRYRKFRVRESKWYGRIEPQSRFFVFSLSTSLGRFLLARRGGLGFSLCVLEFAIDDLFHASGVDHVDCGIIDHERR